MKIQDLLGDLGKKPDLSEGEREAAAKGLAEKVGYAAAALTILPLPGTEVVMVVPLHVGMVVGIGHVYGQDVTKDSAGELLLRIGATVGLSLVGSRLATTAAKVIFPFAGGLLGAPFMYASTIAIGAVARMYFAKHGQLSDEEMKRLYKETLAKARKGFDPTRARSATAQDLAKAAVAEAEGKAPAAAPASEEDDPVRRLERLKSLLDKGLIEQDEYDTVKKRILDGI